MSSNWILDDRWAANYCNRIAWVYHLVFRETPQSGSENPSYGCWTKPFTSLGLTDIRLVEVKRRRCRGKLDDTLEQPIRANAAHLPLINDTCLRRVIISHVKLQRPYIRLNCILKIYSSQVPTVRGNGITSRILEIPVKYITQRSKPSPYPAWRAEPYLRRSM